MTRLIVCRVSFPTILHIRLPTRHRVEDVTMATGDGQCGLIRRGGCFRENDGEVLRVTEAILRAD